MGNCCCSILRSLGCCCCCPDDPNTPESVNGNHEAGNQNSSANGHYAGPPQGHQGGFNGIPGAGFPNGPANGYYGSPPQVDQWGSDGVPDQAYGDPTSNHPLSQSFQSFLHQYSPWSAERHDGNGVDHRTFFGGHNNAVMGR